MREAPFIRNFVTSLGAGRGGGGRVLERRSSLVDGDLFDSKGQAGRWLLISAIYVMTKTINNFVN